MKKIKLLSTIFAFALAFSAISFSACDLLPTLPGGGGDKIENPGGDETEKPGENYGHKEFLIEDFNRVWMHIQELDQENSPRKLTSEHFETFERWMSELRALEWTEDDKKDPDKEKPSEYQTRLDEIEQGCREFLHETDRLVRGGFYVTFSIVPYNYEEDKTENDKPLSELVNPEAGVEHKKEENNEKIQYATIEYWTKTPVSYQEILANHYNENSLTYCTYWDHYVPKIDGITIGAAYTFTESTHVTCYENDPDFYITIQNVNLSGTIDEREEPQWGSFTFWQWMKNGGNRNDRYMWHEYCRDMGMRPVTCDGVLMQPDDVIDSSRTFIMTEQEPLYEIDVVLEMRGETREVGKGHLYYSHSLYEAAIYNDLHVYEMSGSLEHEIYYYLDWFDIYFNGKKIENREIKEYMVEESGTVTLKGRDRYEVSFEIEAQTHEGEIYNYGPYSVVCETEVLYQPAKAEIHLEEFLRNELGEEEYDRVFSGLNFYSDDYTVDYINHSCKIIAKPYVSSGGGNEEPEGPENLENKFRDIVQMEKQGYASEWAMLSTMMDTSVFAQHFDKLNVMLDGCIYCSTEMQFSENINKIFEDYELLVEYVNFYNSLKKDFESICMKYAISQDHVKRFEAFIVTLQDLEFPCENGLDRLEEKRNEYNDLCEQAIRAAMNNQGSSGNGDSQDPSETPVVPPEVKPNAPEGFPRDLSLRDGVITTYPGHEYVGVVYENGTIVNQETGATVGTYTIQCDEMGNVVLDDKGRMTYLITLTIGELSYTYSVVVK